MKKILVNPDRCTGCMMCAMACSQKKTDAFNPARSRVRIVNWEERGRIIPILCQHCEEPVCVPTCPVGAMSKEPGSGVVEIDRKACIDCSVCRKVCPFGAPSLDPGDGQVVLCDLCGGTPECVAVCSTGALEFADLEENRIADRRRGMGEIRKAVLDLEKE